MVRGRSRPGAAYWLVVAVLLALGAVSILTIGYGLLLIGVTLVVLSPFVGLRTTGCSGRVWSWSSGSSSDTC